MNATITVVQTFNPDCSDPQDPRYVWKVIKTTNTVVVAVGQVLDQDEVQSLIDDEITVNVS